MVALTFYDTDYKERILEIPQEYSHIKVVDIALEKAFKDRPIHFHVFLKLSYWLLKVFEEDDMILTYICSTAELTNIYEYTPQLYRKKLFDKLLERVQRFRKVETIEVTIGTGEFATYGRVFYKLEHQPIIYLITSRLLNK